MKKTKLYVAFTLLMIVLLSGCTYTKVNNEDLTSKSIDDTDVSSTTNVTYKTGIYHNKNWNEVEASYTEDIIQDQQSAQTIAQAIFDTIKDEESWNYILKYVFYDEKDEIWIVSFGEDKGISYDGGNLSIALQKKDGKILRIWFS